ncbi:MAG: CPXCG motif-containing cysteine-rich protein [Woeseia sp.]|nr:CPXCG motif-containing cysteine-rich protein [Woeseia sp.]
MHDPLHEKPVRCPYCGERMHIVIDTSAGDQAYIEDCQICCRPMRVEFACSDNEILFLQVSGDS